MSRKVLPLNRGAGMYAQEGLKGEMLQYLRPRESMISGPVKWVNPAWAISFPKQGTEVQREIFVAVSDMGLHVWGLRWEDRWVVKEHVPCPYGQMASMSARMAKRAKGGFFRRVETVVLMKLWDRTGGVIFCESRYKAAEEQVLRIRNAIVALNASTDSSKPAALAANDLVHLDQLHRQGALTDEEWQRAKDACLGRPDSRAESLLDLDRLYQLFRLGALTEYEFRRKKLELLTW